MWNCCMRNNQISTQDENGESKKVEHIKTSSWSKTAKREDNMKKKVRFKVQDNKGGKGRLGINSTNVPVRIRLMVTKEELKMMLSNKNENDAQHTSLEQLLRDMMLREKSVLEIEENGGSINSWRPALESVPEDRSMK
ncbi:uncharacterized protein LOC113856546 [Abrus precatorius]|uniref:Uncharacterized protein LOC113856546 n=1 Tax=Abrus precatorius TaxID=3816 RepID=A0A8B8KK39_ABRPR|nr:uncharacterized protein LOC113856546 [Abrus precatorius]